MLCSTTFDAVYRCSCMVFIVLRCQVWRPPLLFFTFVLKLSAVSMFLLNRLSQVVLNNFSQPMLNIMRNIQRQRLSDGLYPKTRPHQILLGCRDKISPALVLYNLGESLSDLTHKVKKFDNRKCQMGHLNTMIITTEYMSEQTHSPNGRNLE